MCCRGTVGSNQKKTLNNQRGSVDCENWPMACSHDSHDKASAPRAADYSLSGAIGEPPGSPSYYGLAAAEVSSALQANAESIGDPPGSPAYFGITAAASAASPASVGEAPGSASYHGDAAPSGRAAPAPTASDSMAVGLPPGSASYFGISS